jgi:uncharacterized membrane protein YhaH (DUF805 family)
MKNKNTEKKLWFRRKLYGWGWTPITWQGWLVVLFYVLFLISAVTDLDHEWLKNVLFMILSTFILIRICYMKGEKPRWQWGKRK